MSSELKEKIAWLDGFLYAVSAIDCGIRERFSCAFVFDINKGNPIESLASFFSPETKLNVIFSKKMDEQWIRQLESSLQPLLLVKPINCSAIDKLDLQDRRSYLVFRIMDFIQSIISEYHVNSIFSIQSKFDDSEEKYRFFILAFDECGVAIQLSETPEC